MINFDLMEAKDILKEHVAKTITLTDDQFDYFFSHFKPLSFKKGQAIITSGDQVDCEYFVINGSLKSFYINDDLKMFILQFATPTWCHIINVSSLIGYGAIAGWSLYRSMNFAIEGLSAGLALELAPFGIHVTAIAPGLFSTDFLSPASYTTSKHFISDYEDTMVGQMRKSADQLHGKQPGDPKKLAEVVVKLAGLEKPPVHLPIGKDSVAMYRNSVAKTTQEIDEWEELSSSTGHDKSINSINHA